MFDWLCLSFWIILFCYQNTNKIFMFFLCLLVVICKRNKILENPKRHAKSCKHSKLIWQKSFRCFQKHVFLKEYHLEKLYSLVILTDMFIVLGVLNLSWFCVRFELLAMNRTKLCLSVPQTNCNYFLQLLLDQSVNC